MWLLGEAETEPTVLLKCGFRASKAVAVVDGRFAVEALVDIKSALLGDVHNEVEHLSPVLVLTDRQESKLIVPPAGGCFYQLLELEPRERCCHRLEKADAIISG